MPVAIGASFTTVGARAGPSPWRGGRTGGDWRIRDPAAAVGHARPGTWN